MTGHRPFTELTKGFTPARRARVAEILERQNKSWGASSKALANLDRLRDGAAAVVTGQQVGLFGGPMSRGSFMVLPPSSEWLLPI